MARTELEANHASWPEWQHKYTARKPYTGSDEYAVKHALGITVEAGLHYLQGNNAPYFTVTGSIGHDYTGGCIHEDIAHHWPELAPVIALHLSDIDGVPMHPEGNGWYWLAGYYGGAGERYHGANTWPNKTPEQCLQIFADHVRVDIEEARRLATGWQRGIEYQDAKALFIHWSSQQRERWKQEADAAIKLLDNLIAKKGGE